MTASRPRDPSPSPQAIVAAGYDQVAERYLAWSGGRPSEPRRWALSLALAAIPQGADVLELGCGAGLPMTAALAEGRRVTGIDISPEQIRLARVNVPGARFEVGDMLTHVQAPASVDAVVAFYTLTHVPRTELAPLLGRIATWLRPGGAFLGAFGVEDDPGTVEPDWLGVPMYFSHFSARVNRRLVREAGLVEEVAEVHAEPADRESARFLWILARTPAGLSAGLPGPRPPARPSRRD